MPDWRLLSHLLWSTGTRLSILGAIAEAAIRRSFELTIDDLDLLPHAVVILPDHVHVVVSGPPKIAVAEVINRLKGASSHAVNKRTDEQRTETFGWQPDDGALSFGDNALNRVIAYVDHQAEHHAAGRRWATLERVDDGYEETKRRTAT
jgi:putative transposase